MIIFFFLSFASSISLANNIFFSLSASFSFSLKIMKVTLSFYILSLFLFPYLINFAITLYFFYHDLFYITLFFRPFLFLFNVLNKMKIPFFSNSFSFSYFILSISIDSNKEFIFFIIYVSSFCMNPSKVEISA